MKKLIMVAIAFALGLGIGIFLNNQRVLLAEQQGYCNGVESMILQGEIIELDTCEDFLDTVKLQSILDANILERKGFDSSKIGG